MFLRVCLYLVLFVVPFTLPVYCLRPGSINLWENLNIIIIIVKYFTVYFENDFTVKYLYYFDT